MELGVAYALREHAKRFTGGKAAGNEVGEGFAATSVWVGGVAFIAIVAFYAWAMTRLEPEDAPAAPGPHDA